MTKQKTQSTTPSGLCLIGDSKFDKLVLALKSNLDSSPLSTTETVPPGEWAIRGSTLTTDAHWQRATEESVAGGGIRAERRKAGAIDDDSKPSKKPILIGAEESGSAERHAQVDSNHRPTD